MKFRALGAVSTLRQCLCFLFLQERLYATLIHAPPNSTDMGSSSWLSQLDQLLACERGSGWLLCLMHVACEHMWSSNEAFRNNSFITSGWPAAPQNQHAPLPQDVAAPVSMLGLASCSTPELMKEQERSRDNFYNNTSKMKLASTSTIYHLSVKCLNAFRITTKWLRT